MDALTLTWTGITSFLVAIGVSYYLHFKTVKHIGSEMTKLLAIFNQNEETLMRIELQNEKAVKQVELENTKVITKWEYENERLLKKIDRGIEVKERSQIVAELFTLWMQTAPGSSNKALLPDEFAKMNRYSFECAII